MESPLLVNNSQKSVIQSWTLIGQYFSDQESHTSLNDSNWLREVFSYNVGKCYRCNYCSKQYIFKSAGVEIQIYYNKQKVQGKQQINCGDCKELICGKKFMKCHKCKTNNFLNQTNCNNYICQSCFAKLCHYCENPPQLFQQEMRGCTQKASNLQRYSYLIGMLILSILFFPIFLVLDFSKDIFEEKMLRFHQYILSKYKPIVLLFLYQIFLIVYLVKVIILLMEFIVQANRSRWRDTLQ